MSFCFVFYCFIILTQTLLYIYVYIYRFYPVVTPINLRNRNTFLLLTWFNTHIRTYLHDFSKSPTNR